MGIQYTAIKSQRSVICVLRRRVGKCVRGDKILCSFTCKVGNAQISCYRDMGIT
jgi:hypothetical protein